LWKIDGQKLINKAGFWQSNDSWTLKPQDSMFHLENNSTGRFASLNYIQGDWIVATYWSNKPLWRKVEISDEDYFKLATKYNGSQFLTATSAHNLMLDRGM